MSLKLLPTESYSYALLPSANPPEEYTSLHNRIYQFWKDTWLAVLKDLNVDSNQLTDDFLRQDLIAAVYNEQDILGVHLYSFFSLDTLAAREHRYLAGNYPSEFFTKLNASGIRTVMSMEYLTVNSNWRKHKSNIHIGALVAALGFNVLQHYCADTAIAPARRDHKVHELAYSFGGDCVMANVLNHNVPCDLVSIRREKIRPHSEEVDALKKQLWAKKIHATATEKTLSSTTRTIKRVA